MKRKTRARWLSPTLEIDWASNRDEIDDFEQPSLVCVEWAEPLSDGVDVLHRVFDLRGLRWSFELALVPGPLELQ